jgi:hypothetical protein
MADAMDDRLTIRTRGELGELTDQAERAGFLLLAGPMRAAL